MSSGSRSSALAVTTLIYTAAVCLARWVDRSRRSACLRTYPYADKAALLPAAVLLLAGLGIITVAGLR